MNTIKLYFLFEFFNIVNELTFLFHWGSLFPFDTTKIRQFFRVQK